ncbi:hypothetical protein [Acinetobacter puyangensis]|uniref:hypothetical protein n=1 Tax=Acinetobacter puyangensis TaxID=1096779 RepID=UPI003A4DDD1B
MSEIDKKDLYRQALNESVHFSVKTINSNIEKGGIRLSQSQGLDLPYLSARTLLHEGFLIPTDYQANAGKTASIFKVVKAAMLDDDISTEDQEFQDHVRDLKPALSHAFDDFYSAGTDHIDIRMRQLLIPKDVGYISISPLTAAGVNYLVNKEVDQIKEDRKNKDSQFNNIQTAVFGIGGANPQNVGSLVRSMQRPITLDSPATDEAISKAFKVFYKGFDYYIPKKITFKDDKKIVPDIILWAKILTQQLIATAQNTHQKYLELDIHSPETNLKVRRAELFFLKHISNIVLYQGKLHLQILKNVQDKLPTINNIDAEDTDSTKPLTPLLHPSVEFIKQGLIDPNLRNDLWRIKFADDLAQKIIGQKFLLDPAQPEIDIPLDQNAKAYIARRLREIIR